MTRKLTSAEIRQTFLDYFAERGHTVVPSASLVPAGDPTLLFTNAGMNQFKDVFLGTGTRPYTRAVDTQKCMRVSGKHNDLEDVGHDGTHHTFFEMLGNWSFGDYYKKEAISWAWDLLTRVYGLDKNRLWVTIFEDDQGNLPRDDEAAEYWRTETDINPEHILPFGRKDNFWMMAETGPCGPNSEIHYDRGPEACDKQGVPGHVCRVNGDCTRFTEIWNLVFIQYNSLGGGQLEPLPAKHVDTGMGFERMVALLQGVPTNYHTDLFWPIIEKTQSLAGHTDAEREANIVAYRVIADHVRAGTFLIGDGVLPSNEGQGYVLRMVLRRAIRYGRKLGFTRPFMAELADLVIKMMGHVFPELPARTDFIKATITAEEQRFLRTLDQGLTRLDAVIADVKARGATVIPGNAAFFLHDTLGLPFEVTRDIAAEHGLTVDEEGYRVAREEQRARGRAAGDFQMETDEHGLLYPILYDWIEDQECGRSLGFDPYSTMEVKTCVAGMVRNDGLDTEAAPGEAVELVLENTGFYVESGGQVADTGRIVGPDWEVRVEDVRRPLEGMVVHIGRVVRGHPRVGDPVLAQVDIERRRDIMRNHTATHLLHRALRDVLGSHVAQAGSLVSPERLRFDYNHEKPLTDEQREEIERRVVEAILANYEVNARQEAYRDALAQGVTALFGEKYGEVVRVLRVGDAAAPFSQELCGGTHVSRTGDIGPFLITSESGIGAGLRRIEAVTGRGALKAMQAMRARQEQAVALLGGAADELAQRIERLHNELREARKEIENLTRKLARADFQALLNNVVQIEGIPVLAARVDVPDADTLREMADWFRDKMQGGVIVLGAVIDDKPLLIAATTKALAQERGIHAGNLVRDLARVVGGGGGGRPDMAQAGGRDPSKLSEALDKVPSLLRAMLTK
ncbi:MAG TPA: alanine--tRNA ligase [Anaerolineae bacterium]|nr:alanine--tRNA ligase [Anaerolineae bacterium]HQK13123.1 alanine--tRNA ligase [Anaerolineae bacterium]